MHVNKAKHKIEDNKIMWFNGRKWLIRQTCEDNADAKSKYKKLKELKNLKDA